MVRFGFIEAQEIFRATARDFTRRELPPGVRERIKLSQFPKDLIKKLADVCFLGLRIPEEYGGQMSDVLTCGMACEDYTRQQAGVSP